MRETSEPATDSRWTLVFEGYDPANERIREALCTLGNGYWATRGALPEATNEDVHYPGTYRAGCYNRALTAVAGRIVCHEDLVRLPNWLPVLLRFEDDENWFDPDAVEWLAYRQELDLRRGVLTRTGRCRDQQDRETAIVTRLLVHQAKPHLAGLEMEVTLQNWSGSLAVRSILDARVRNTLVPRYRPLNNYHLLALESGEAGPDGLWLRVRTAHSRIEVVQAIRTRVSQVERRLVPKVRSTADPDLVADEFVATVAAGQPVTIEKIGALFTSQDPAIAEPGYEARRAVQEAGSFDDLRAEQERAWEQLWDRCRVDLEGTVEIARNINLHIFHILQTVSPKSRHLDIGVPARGWHGEAYRGHVFWDELFVLPFVAARLPDLARHLLMYRYNRLPAARRMAAQAGLRGAMFPWQSGSNGDEVTAEIHINPRSGRWVPDNSQIQRHIGAAIVYNVWQYVETTGDREFLDLYGSELILEIARFWSSAAAYNADLDRWEIHGVMGPDEFHDGYPGAAQPGLSNNSYTNVMAVWVLCRAFETLERISSDRRRELLDSLDITPEELARWDSISRRMRLIFHEGDILSQFEGYADLKELDWDAYRARYGNIQRLDWILLAEDDTPNRYKIGKQPDVLMLFYLLPFPELRALLARLGYALDEAAFARTFDYYTARSSHGSTLSRVVHAANLIRHDRRGSWQRFDEAIRTDVAAIQGGSTAAGIHLGAMAGTVDLIVRGYTGFAARAGVLHLSPQLPDGITRLAFPFQFHGQWIDLDLTPDRLTLWARPGSDRLTQVRAGETAFDLAPGEAKTIPLHR